MLGLSRVQVSKMMRSVVNNSKLQRGGVRQLGVGIEVMGDVFGFRVENDRVLL